MAKTNLSSRDRMLMAMEHLESDYVPCCFMIFKVLQEKCQTQVEFIHQQLQLGLDVTLSLPDLPIRFHPEVKVREWKVDSPEEECPLLYKEYYAPAGKLTAIVNKTQDWPYGDQVPLFDDYLIPRSRKFLVTRPEDLESLKFLFAAPTAEDIASFREKSRRLKKFAKEQGILVAGGWGGNGDAGAMGMDAVMWLCGIRPAILWAIDQPETMSELLEIISKWNLKRIEIILDAGVDLLIRRAWYESTDFWSPSLYRRFMVPPLKKEIQLTHQAGAKFGYIMTSGFMPLLDDFLQLGFDVLIGVDPVQGKGTDLRMLKQKLGGKICLWGGVNAFLTVEKGTEEEVEQAVCEAIKVLAPGGGLILSPVDNIRDPSDYTWRNVLKMIETWKKLRAYPIR